MQLLALRVSLLDFIRVCQSLADAMRPIGTLVVCRVSAILLATVLIPHFSVRLLANRPTSETHIPATEEARSRFKRLHKDEIDFLQWMRIGVASSQAVDRYCLNNEWIQRMRDSASVLDFSALIIHLINRLPAEIPKIPRAELFPARPALVGRAIRRLPSIRALTAAKAGVARQDHAQL